MLASLHHHRQHQPPEVIATLGEFGGPKIKRF
jgi:hypothetical protein